MIIMMTKAVVMLEAVMYIWNKGMQKLVKERLVKRMEASRPCPALIGLCIEGCVLESEG